MTAWLWNALHGSQHLHLPHMQDKAVADLWLQVSITNFHCEHGEGGFFLTICVRNEPDDRLDDRESRPELVLPPGWKMECKRLSFSFFNADG